MNIRNDIQPPLLFEVIIMYRAVYPLSVTKFTLELKTLKIFLDYFRKQSDQISNSSQVAYVFFLSQRRDFLTKVALKKFLVFRVHFWLIIAAVFLLVTIKTEFIFWNSFLAREQYQTVSRSYGQTLNCLPVSNYLCKITRLMCDREKTVLKYVAIPSNILPRRYSSN